MRVKERIEKDWATEEQAFWLAWSQVEGIGPVLIRRLQEHFGSLAIAWNAHPEDLLAINGVGHHTVELICAGRSHLRPQALFTEHRLQNPQFWTPIDADYPHLLRETPDPPPLLYYQGQVDRLENQGMIKSIGIVGTRQPTDYARRWTRRITQSLVHAGFSIVSGLAIGIDTEAHEACLRAGGRTVAVLGSGLDVIYPYSNRRLAQKISQQGLILSEYPAGTQPDRLHFPQRNRIIAGLCRAVLVMEASDKSGALITARLANEYGRDVYVLPGSLDNFQSKGCLSLMNQGAQVILGEAALLDFLQTMPQFHTIPSCNRDTVPGQLSLLSPEGVAQNRGSTAAGLEAFPVNLTPELEQVLQAVTLEGISLDAIVEAIGRPAGHVLSALTQLEIMGLVIARPGSRYQRS